MLTARQPQASVLAGEDSTGEKAIRQPGRCAVTGNRRAESRSVCPSDGQREDPLEFTDGEIHFEGT